MENEKLKNFIYKYEIAYLVCNIIDCKESIVQLSKEIYYDPKNRCIREIHSKYFYNQKLSSFSDDIDNLAYRMLDYDPDSDFYLYDSYNVYKNMFYKNKNYTTDDINNKMNKNFSKDDIFYYKYRTIYSESLEVIDSIF